jgi:hypothetical protein
MDITMDLEKFLNPSDKWDAKYRQAVIAALRKYQPERAEKIIERYLSLERCADFNLTNTYSRRIFRKELLATALDLETNLFRPGLVVMWASIADRAWAYCDRSIAFDYRAAKQKLRNAFKGMNFIGVIEPGYYPKVKWERDGQVGCLVSFHAHIIVWDTSESKLRRHQRRIKIRFLPVAPDDRRTPRLDQLKTLKDLQKALRYSTKMPFEGYRKKKKKQKNKGDKNNQTVTETTGRGDEKLTSIEQRHCELKAIHHYRLFKFSRKHTLFDAWLAGGQGAKLLLDTRQAALKTARRQCRPRLAHSDSNRRGARSECSRFVSQPRIIND